jgi:ATPase subunit of ABC transporter with duplicated ATPase domains
MSSVLLVIPAAVLCPAGGQKARVVFTAISLSNPHILLLDEPTNHLDMQSIDALCDALDEFQGGVVVISHDSQLLSRLCADEERSEVRALAGHSAACMTLCCGWLLLHVNAQ